MHHDEPEIGAIAAIKRYKEQPRPTLLSMTLQIGSVFVAALVGAYADRHIELTALLVALAVGALLILGIRLIKRLDQAVTTLGDALLRIEYLKVNSDPREPVVTEADIYVRATHEILKAGRSIDIFTSYLLETESPDERCVQAKATYLDTLLTLAMERPELKYRRLVQVPPKKTIEQAFGRTRPYLQHLYRMLDLQLQKQRVWSGALIEHRPTTYAIIDDRLLLWQINQIAGESEMKMYGIFIVRDPARELVRHFRHEFDNYLPEAVPLPTSRNSQRR